MERPPFIPNSELPTPIDESIETLPRQGEETIPNEAKITEGLFVAEALSRQPHMLYEKISKIENTEEPFEKMHERQVEVKDEPTQSPVVSIGSVVASMTPPQIDPQVAQTAEPVSFADDMIAAPQAGSTFLSVLLQSAVYRRAILFGLGGAVILLLSLLLIALLT